ncbi:His Kinase A (phospho-acceptor) domain-containing protein [Flavobacterium caeni]|uniref:histidine kinase n=2 Tax=Flavobacterium caeni TaxID=490189 RepID=A0A1G5IZD1_9FLAO|nr:His Kinase A (phospho-acceptor) domain-containing protein [Flavobacterium caeni]
MSISSEASGLGADNQLLSVSKIIYSPVVDESGSVPYIILTFTDEKPLADQIELAEILSEHTKELADANQRLRNSNAELEQFAYIASHDLQEPLRKINMFAGLLGNALENPNERIQKYLANIGVSVQRMTNLIQDVLSYSQLSRKQEVFRTTDLNEIFRETLADFDLIVDEKNAKVVSANLPVIDAIPLQMVQLFHNLISNALKYQKPDVAPRIDISWFALTEDRRVELGLPQLEKGYCGLVFADNGIGFSEEYEQKIFNIFQRLHGKGQYEGTGIGLAMCKKIAENHHGLIYARGKEGEGASFTVVLPFDRP